MRNIQWQTYGVTVIHPFTIGFILIMVILILSLTPRKKIVIPLLLGSLYVTELQRIVILNFDFDMLRILILFIWLRVIFDKEQYKLKLNRIDSTERYIKTWESYQEKEKESSIKEVEKRGFLTITQIKRIF